MFKNNKKPIFLIGDKVFDIREGWGVVRDLKVRNIYCVVVDFYMDTLEYTACGRSNENDKVSILRHYEYKLCELVKDVEKCKNN